MVHSRIDNMTCAGPQEASLPQGTRKARPNAVLEGQSAVVGLKSPLVWEDQPFFCVT